MNAPSLLPEPRLTRAEYWLLETAVEYLTPLHFLESKGRLQPWFNEQFNKTGHGLERPQLADCLAGLLAAGLIEGWASEDERGFVPTRDQLLASLGIRPTWEEQKVAFAEGRRVEHYLLYRLTAQGGAVWEAFAAPRWERFFGHDFDDELHVGHVICMDRKRLEQYLGYLKLLGKQALGRIIDFEYVQFDECGPWTPTYWKTLPSGFRASFNWTEPPIEGEHVECSAENVARGALEWLAFAGLCKFRDGWYHWK